MQKGYAQMLPYKILAVHNSYQQPGGEDAVFAAEKSLMSRYGLQREEYKETNWRINGMNKIRLAAQTIWSHSSQKKLTQLLRDTKPDIAHFHNTFPLISPAVYYACHKVGVPVVQSLHNYRLLCPGSYLFREGKICLKCLDKKIPWPAIHNACYRQSTVQTAVVSAMITTHQFLGTWNKQVDLFIALTEFAKKKFIQSGIPEKKIVVKPNFIDPDSGTRKKEGEYALFVGRLSEEKGLRTLLKAWKHLKTIPLMIGGDGPLREKIETFLYTHNQINVKSLGRLRHDAVIELMKGARFLVFPSEWYEGFPMTILEAFACGVPVITTDLGSMTEIVEDGRTGLHFTPGDAQDLVAKVEWAWTHPSKMAEMGKQARREYELKYTAEQNYRMLMRIYEMAIRNASA